MDIRVLYDSPPPTSYSCPLHRAQGSLPRASEGGCPWLPQDTSWASFALKEMGSFVSTILQTGMQPRETFPLKECKNQEGDFS